MRSYQPNSNEYKQLSKKADFSILLDIWVEQTNEDFAKEAAEKNKIKSWNLQIVFREKTTLEKELREFNSFG